MDLVRSVRKVTGLESWDYVSDRNVGFSLNNIQRGS